MIRCRGTHSVSQGRAPDVILWGYPSFHYFCLFSIEKMTRKVLVSYKNGFRAAFDVQVFVESSKVETGIPGLGSWCTCFEPYIFYERHYEFSKILKTHVEWFPVRSEQNRYLDGDFPQHFSDNISAAMDHLTDSADAALRILAAFMSKQLKAIFTDSQMSSPPEDTLARWGPIKTIPCVESGFSSMIASFPPFYHSS